MQPTVGMLVTPNVRLVRPLREGGMGRVWVGEHLTLGRELAVKFISPELLEADPSIVTRFEVEAQTAAQIKSQHVVQTFDHGISDDGTPFIVMELLEGSTLAEWLELEGTLNPRDTLALVAQVAGVLSKTHELGVVHRDIKPENIFLVDSEAAVFVKVLDFGVAKHTGLSRKQMTGVGALIGTPEYMSPEQLMGEADYRADLWSLAVVAYKSLTGKSPFRGKGLGTLVLEITQARFSPPSQVAEVAAEFDEFFARALAEQLDDRFDSAVELAKAFKRAQRAAASRARKGGPPHQDSRPDRGGSLEDPSTMPEAGQPPPAPEATTRPCKKPRKGAQPEERGKPVCVVDVGEAATKRGLGRALTVPAGDGQHPQHGAKGTLMSPGAPPPPASAAETDTPAGVATKRSAGEGERDERPRGTVAAWPPVTTPRPPPKPPRKKPPPPSAAETGASTKREGQGSPPPETPRTARRRSYQQPSMELDVRHPLRVRPKTGVVRLRQAAEPHSHRLGDLVLPTILVVAVTVFVLLLDPPAVARLAAAPSTGATGALAAATVLLVPAAVSLFRRGRRLASGTLQFAGAGLAVLTACLAVVTWSVAFRAEWIGEYARWALSLAPLAASAVSLGLGVFGLLRIRLLLRSSRVDRAMVVVVAVLSLLALVAGAQLARRGLGAVGSQRHHHQQ